MAGTGLIAFDKLCEDSILKAEVAVDTQCGQQRGDCLEPGQCGLVGGSTISGSTRILEQFIMLNIENVFCIVCYMASFWRGGECSTGRCLMEWCAVSRTAALGSSYS